MPDRSEKYTGYEAREAEDNTLHFLSKSRVREYAKNPEHFRLRYLEGLVGQVSDAMLRGTAIHESIEYYYERALQDPLAAIDDPALLLPDDLAMWADYTEPYITNFLKWERERYEQVSDIDAWLPVGVEIEHWREDEGFLSCPLEGTVDVVLESASVPGVLPETGLTIVDFKTGKVPKEQYRDEGIHIELAFYALLLSDEYDITSTAAYYPREDELIEYIPDEDSVEWILSLVSDCWNQVQEYDGGHFETNPGPLCKWGLEDDEESDYYGICPCSWGEPAKNEEWFRALVEADYNAYEIAEYMGTTTDAVSYWKYKLDL